MAYPNVKPQNNNTGILSYISDYKGLHRNWIKGKQNTQILIMVLKQMIYLMMVPIILHLMFITISLFLVFS